MPVDPSAPFDPQQLIDLQAIAFDVDGVLTDGTLTWSTAGTELKSFSFTDIMGISLLRRLDIKMALISGEPSPLVDRYAEKMRIPFFKDVRDKVAALRDFTAKAGVSLERTCFFGDDVNDLSAMQIAGLCACPSNAAAEVLAHVTGHGFVAAAPGGHGAVRAFANAVLAARNLSGHQVFQLPLPQ
jgi:3-deoxy-D-manno-octulosonate 8-phosphate phosphatase (KDO 8-P phosphatase)